MSRFAHPFHSPCGALALVRYTHPYPKLMHELSVPLAVGSAEMGQSPQMHQIGTEGRTECHTAGNAGCRRKRQSEPTDVWVNREGNRRTMEATS